MPERAGPLLLYALLALAFFAATGVGSYVYAHEPPRDALVVELKPTTAPASSTVSGSIVSIEGKQVTLITSEGQPVTLEVPEGTPVEELLRAEEALPAGVTVNVGIDNTSFGQVLTGIVAIEGSR